MNIITDLMDCQALLENARGVIFDLDDTLYSEKDYVRSGYRAVAAALNREDLAEPMWQAFLQGLPAIDAVLEAENLLHRKEEALHAYRFHAPTISLYPGVRQLLERLTQTKLLGMITDGRPEGQRAKLKALDLEGYFRHILITDELGGQQFRKPSQVPFRRMQQALDIPFRELVYIGDNPKKDFIAPQALGMQTIWFQNKDGLYT